MTMKTILTFVAALAMLTSTAGAALADDDNDTPKLRYGYTLTAGATEIGDLGFANIGVRFHVARQIVEGLRADVDFAFLTTHRSSDDEDGLLMGNTSRFSLGAAYDLAAFDGGSMLSGSVAFIGGVGRQYIAWDRGTVTRNDLFVGIDGMMGFNFRNSRNLRVAKALWMSLGVRFFIADSPGPDKRMVVCGGPCDEPSAGNPRDFGFLFNYGLSFGR
jgi:hypothetical protein